MTQCLEELLVAIPDIVMEVDNKKTYYLGQQGRTRVLW